MGRTIRKIIWHCSATPEGRAVTVDEIRTWHVRDNKWKDIGYHYVIDLEGNVHRGRAEATAGAHVAGHNADSIGICYVGGMDAQNRHPKDTRTPAQKRALYRLTDELKQRYPGATVHGHNEFANKACPSFDVQRELSGTGPRASLAGSRTVTGAQVATAGVGVGMVAEVVEQAAPAIPLLNQMMDYMPWLVAALVLGGIGWIVWARIDDNRKGYR